MVLAPDCHLNLAAERSYNTVLTNSSLLPLLLLSLARQKNSPETAKEVKKEYDYIVVGAGTAGSVVAARLSEIPCVSVLLLEAGSAPPKLNDVLGIGRNFWLTDLDWQFHTTPQKHTGRLLRNRELAWPGGKGLGGSTLLNAAFHVRGNRKDYDNWEALGATGWSYKDVLPYFKKLEDNRDPEYVSNGYHGVGGPVTVMRPRYDPEIRGAVFRAARSIGYKVVDSNAKRQTGFYDPQANLRDGQRCSTAKAYLVPADYRSNLDILPNAMVEKVVIKNRRATGVLFSYEGYTYQVRARREVIMSAGAVQSAQLLMLSGIGPKEELQKFNIPVHADLPVGRSLQDHGGATREYLLSPRIPEITEKLSDPENIKLYIHNRTGPLASTEACTNIAFLLNDEVRSKRDDPNYEIYFAESSTTVVEAQFNLKPEAFQQVYGPYENRAIMMCFAQQVSPKSRGTVTLRSANPYDEPLIDPNYFGEPEDIEEIVEALKTCNRIARNPHMQKIGVRPFETLYPGCEQYAGDEDKYFRCQARSALITLSHPCGTAKMGNPRDPSTVVDPKLRVKNIEGLRVVDNSIMPQIVRGNTGVPAMMIGEKASDIIKETINCHNSNYESDYYYDDDHTENQEYPDFDNYEPAIKQNKPVLLPQNEYDDGYEGEHVYPSRIPEYDSKDNFKQRRPFSSPNRNNYAYGTPGYNPSSATYDENYNVRNTYKRPSTGMQGERGRDLNPESWKDQTDASYRDVYRPDRQNWYLASVNRNR